VTRQEFSEEALEAWLQCERRAWLERHRPESRSTESGLERYLREQHADLGRAYRHQLIRTAGSTVTPSTGTGAAADTVRALRDGAAAVLDGTLTAEGVGGASAGMRLRARLDVLRRVREGWAVETIAAGTRVRPHHIRRLAFGRLVAEANGLPVRRSAVACVVRAPSPDGPRLRVQDVSAVTADALRRLPARIGAAGASLRAAREPRTAIGPHCHRPRTCPFLSRCWAPYDGHSIFEVPGLRSDTRRALRGAGWSDVRRVPRRAPGLEPAEHHALNDTRADRVRVDFGALHTGLAELSFPVAYLDMEFATPAVPWLPGTNPFQPLPFQFSVHLEDAEGGVHNLSFLHREAARDPRPALAGALAEALAGAGSIVVYDASAETLLLTELARAVPTAAATLRSAAERSWDLLALVRSAIRHPGFGTGWGLKRVAATLAPGSYENVELADGLAAQTAWRQLLRSEDAGLAARLRRYCEADSRALLRIVRVLRHWAAGGSGGPAGI